MKSCVVLSSYNGEKYIVEQLSSILNQTKPIDYVFIADDNSSDNTYEIINNFININNLENWKCSKNDNNIGWKANFCNLIKNVPDFCDVIFLSDQDDIWKNNKVKLMMDVFENNKDVSFLFSDAEIVYQDKEANKVAFDSIECKNNKVIICDETTHQKRPGCVFAVKRDFAQSCFNNYWKENFAHDSLLWLYAYSHDNLYYLDEKLITFRRLLTSSTFVNKKKNRYILKSNLCKERIDTIESIISTNSINPKAKACLTKALKLEYNRYDLFTKKSVVSWIKCLKYIKFYPIRQFIGDLLFTITYTK